MNVVRRLIANEDSSEPLQRQIREKELRILVVVGMESSASLQMIRRALRVEEFPLEFLHAILVFAVESKKVHWELVVLKMEIVR
jgi:hypothetical protein